MVDKNTLALFMRYLLEKTPQFVQACRENFYALRRFSADNHMAAEMVLEGEVIS